MAPVLTAASAGVAAARPRQSPRTSFAPPPSGARGRPDGARALHLRRHAGVRGGAYLRSRGCATSWRRPSWPSRWASTCSAWASTTVRTSWSPRPLSPSAGIATRTERIRLTSAVTVLSWDDPVRVFQDFATPSTSSPAVARRSWSGAARSSSRSRCSGTTWTITTDCFAEKLELLLALRDSERVSWSGQPPRRARRRRGLSAARPGSAADLGGGGRLAAVDRPRRGARAAAGAGDHRRRARALRAAGASSTATPPARPGTTRPAAGEHQLAHLRGGHARAGGATSSSRPTPG